MKDFHNFQKLKLKSETWGKGGIKMKLVTDQIAKVLVQSQPCMCASMHTHTHACTHTLSTSLLKCIKQPEAGAPINSYV